MLFENWKNSPSHRAKLFPQKSGFSAFLSHEKVTEKSSDFIAQFLYEPCNNNNDNNNNNNNIIIDREVNYKLLILLEEL